MKPQRLTDQEYADCMRIARAALASSSVRLDEIFSRSRTSRISNARQIVCFALRQQTGMSFPRIGLFLDRNHATVIHACEVIAKRGGLAESILGRFGLDFDRLAPAEPLCRIAAGN